MNCLPANDARATPQFEEAKSKPAAKCPACGDAAAMGHRAAIKLSRLPTVQTELSGSD
jgi:hypothetical protein